MVARIAIAIAAVSLSAIVASAAAPIAEPTKPLWLLERTAPALVSARTFGTSHYNHYDAGATLSILCNGAARRLRLEVDVKALGFASDAYEGPDATKHGPLKLTTAAHAPVAHGLAGYWSGAGSYQVGVVFVFEAAIPGDELALWLASATAGQTVTGELDGMTVAFKWPSNSDALRDACPVK